MSGQRLPYDAWGYRRDLAGDAVTGSVRGYTEPVDNKGFTGQEELDQLGLVHLNGRIYDPFVGRFLSADPKIQDPTHSQSYNRYTYGWDNPTNDVDPTGFDAATPTVEVTATRLCGEACMARFMDALRMAGNSRLVTLGSRAVPVASAGYLGWKAGGSWYENYGWKIILPDFGVGADEMTKIGMLYAVAAEEHKKEEEKKKDEKKKDEKVLDSKDGDGKTDGKKDGKNDVVNNPPHSGDVTDGERKTSRRPIKEVKDAVDEAATDENGNLICAYCGILSSRGDRSCN